MAHGFIDKGDETTFVSKRELPWHGLGKVVDSMTSEECIRLAGLDYTVELAEMVALTSKPLDREEFKIAKPSLQEMDVIARKVNDIRQFNTTSNVPNNFATYRTDTKQILGVVGNRYSIVQNSTAFDFFDTVIGQGHARYETAGALGIGETIFVTAKLPSMDVANDEVEKYLLFTNSHDGSSAVTVMYTPVRVVCNNTLTAALSSRSTYKKTFRHTKSVNNKLNYLKATMALVEKQSSTQKEIFEHWNTITIGQDILTELAIKAFNLSYDSDKLAKGEKELTTRSTNILNDILEYHEGGVGQERIRGTKWGAYNAISGYIQNVKKYSSNESAFTSIIEGAAATSRQKAFNYLISN